MNEDTGNIEVIARLSKDLKKAATELTASEARYLVDAYYTIQEYRIAAAAQVREAKKGGEPNSVLQWLFDNQKSIENQIKRALDTYTDSQPIGVWAKSICGIGPVIAAGLMAHIDIEKAPTAGHIWSFAGLDPTVEWGKGEKRPWNARLKVLCWKIGESFVKVSGNDRDVYGKLYLERKQQELAANDAGKFADQAKSKLEKCNIGKETDAYKCYIQGKLPPGHIHARAKRYAVKLFLAHYHEMAYRYRYNTNPPNPYPIAILNHAHKIDPPEVSHNSRERQII
jgi:hypothetical protein